ncbi:hypothetical protein Tco_1179522, partial [Tanacetum coccineum]
EVVMLRTFPFSLAREAKTWLNELDEGTITSILDAGGIFLYNTPNEAFKILEDKVNLKLDFSISSQNDPKPKTVVSTGGGNIKSDHAMLMEKFKALATKIDSEFLIIRKELKEMRDGRRDNHTSQIYKSDDMPMCVPIEANYEDAIKPIPTTPNLNPINSNSSIVSPFLKDCTVHILHTNAKTFADDVLPNHVGNKELKSFDGIGTGKMTKKENGVPKEPHKEWKINEKAVPHKENVYSYLWYPTELPILTVSSKNPNSREEYS